jgi:3-oxocholest-4-en-26-oate---CoA ligase
MSEPEWHWATALEAVADVVGDRPAIVQGGRRETWSEFDDRAARFAAALSGAGVAVDAPVAAYLYNCPEFLEVWIGAYKVRAVPINVNFRYLAEEVQYVLDNADAEALVFHTSLANQIAPIVGQLPKLKLIIGVDDGGDISMVPGAVEYEKTLAAHDPAPRINRPADDRTMFFTGGTTGMPKGVLGKVGPGVHSLAVTVPPVLGHAPAETLDEVIAITKAVANSMELGSIPACPLMHGTGMTLGALITLLFGGRVALLENRRFDADELWDLAARESITTVAIVGDPFARPMLAALDAKPRADLEALRFLTSAGAMFATEMKEGLLRHLPQITIFDYIASTEAAMGLSISTATAIAPTGSFLPNPGVAVFDENDQPVTAGSGVSGIVGVSVGIFDGYYKDSAKSAATIREVDGVVYSFPGDWATVEADGTLQLLGRGSQCINTGGEKVFPEEVEEIVKRHDDVDDCLIFGIPDERFGQRVVGVYSARPGAAPGPDDVIAAARAHLSSYKLPRRLVAVATTPRSAVGKPDYVTARELFDAATPA